MGPDPRAFGSGTTPRFAVLVLAAAATMWNCWQVLAGAVLGTPYRLATERCVGALVSALGVDGQDIDRAAAGAPAAGAAGAGRAGGARPPPPPPPPPRLLPPGRRDSGGDRGGRRCRLGGRCGAGLLAVAVMAHPATPTDRLPGRRVSRA
ncbi:hypothetical protein, partial [Nocardia asiatica]|uniref:hypothetical protein n=1 Tax=Nocardia asiatica TaxID=209252 RepID=UPI002458DE4E